MERTLDRTHTLSTVIVLALTVFSSLAGVSSPDIYTDPESLIPRTRAEDAGMLAIVVPVMAIALARANRGSARWRVVWLGSLAFSAYMWSSRTMQLEFNRLFLVYALLLTLSAFTLIHATGTTDATRFRQALEGRLNTRLVGGTLLLLAAGLGMLWLSDIVPATFTGDEPLIVEEFGPTGLATVAIDLGLVVPSMILAGILMLRLHTWGYLLSGVILAFGALLGPSLVAITIADYIGGVALTPGLIIGTVLPPLVSAIFALRYLSVLR